MSRRRIVPSFCALALAGCLDLDAQAPAFDAGPPDAGPPATREIRLLLPPDLAPNARLTATWRHDDTERRLETFVRPLTADEVADQAAALPPIATPAEVVHVAVGEPGAWEAIGYGAADADEIQLAPWAGGCDLDGDGQLTCEGGCCDHVDPALRPRVLDCLDRPADAVVVAEAAHGGLLLADAKRRRAAGVHAFRASERATDYFECGNGLDDDCAGGDLPCASRDDGDGDGFGMHVDCDDTDPAVFPGAEDRAGDGLDQNCDGLDQSGTDLDLDGHAADGDPPDCDDRDPLRAPGRWDLPCDAVDADCDGIDPCGGTADRDGDGFVPATGDCDDTDPGRAPGLSEWCGDGVDQDCDGLDPACHAADGDRDGVPGGADCDDDDPTRHPGAPERCRDLVDQDCNGLDDPCDPARDRDGDGWPVPADCDDRDPDVHPQADERCNRADDDCDGVADEGGPGGETAGECGNACGEGRWRCLRGEPACELPAPAAEVCNGEDDDCDGEVDEAIDPRCYEGPAPTEGVGTCRAGTSACLDGVPQPCVGQVVPASVDKCDGTDDDCDGAVDQALQPCYGGPPETLGRGRCHGGVRPCVDGVEADCIGEVQPASETCNGLDDDCDGETDEGLEIACGSGVCGDLVSVCRDAEWSLCQPPEGPPVERCNGADDDCDGDVDEDFDFRRDPAHCGGCGLACEADERCCDGRCTDAPLCGMEARPCARDADCPAEAPSCVEGRCAPCLPEGHEGCGGDTLCCQVVGQVLACVAATLANCEACGSACPAGAADACLERECRCGDGPACAGATPRCDDGRCVECVGDADCDGAFGGNECVEGVCRPCDPGNHDGCGPQQLCCGDRCVAGRLDRDCGGCGLSCNPLRVDRCVDRGCACGPGPACPDDRPLCLDGSCAACRVDDDCGAPGLVCAGGMCTGCGGEVTCPTAGPRPVCDAGGFCRGCAGDAECADSPRGHQCVGGACEACDPTDGGGCAPRGATPICDPETRACRACEADAECPGEVCVDGACRQCDRADHRGCDEAGPAPICTAGLCRSCEDDAECAARPGESDRCEDGRCLP